MVEINFDMPDSVEAYCSFSHKMFGPIAEAKEEKTKRVMQVYSGKLREDKTREMHHEILHKALGESFTIHIYVYTNVEITKPLSSHALP